MRRVAGLCPGGVAVSMRDDVIDPHDPTFLLSQSLDGELPEPLRRELEDSLANSPSLREQAEEFRALHRLLSRWASRPVELDWKYHAACIEAQTEEVKESEKLEKVDRLLERWALSTDGINTHAFRNRVMAEVRGDRSRRRLTTLIRLGVPLAAAAAVVLAVSAGLWRSSLSGPVVSVAYHRGDRDTAQIAAGDSAGVEGPDSSKVVVSFVRQEVVSPSGAGGHADISFGVVGAAAPAWSQIVPVP